MRRGTTPTINLTLDVVSTDIATAWITIAQEGRIVIDKDLDSEGVTIEDVTEEGSTHAVIHMTLTQVDTLALANGLAELQVRALMDDGKAVASGIYKLTASRILKDGEITLEA